MQERAARKSCLRITLEENGEAKCQASDHSIVCKIALNSMSAVDVKTKGKEHSFITWWGSMCCGGAWGQEVHQTSHAALHHRATVKACNTSLLAGEFCFHTGMSHQKKQKNIQNFLITMTRLTHQLHTQDERMTEKKKPSHRKTMLFAWIPEKTCQVC